MPEPLIGRAFVAVVPPPDVLDAVGTVVASIGAVPGVRLAAREQWHLTLQFLGNHADLDATAVLLERAVPASLTAGRLQLGGFGAFPNARRARVLWLGACEGAGWLRDAAAAVALALAPIGFVPERDDAQPHLTLARARSPLDAREIVRDAPAAVGPSWRAAEVLLVHSTLGAGAATHRVHTRVELLEGA